MTRKDYLNDKKGSIGLHIPLNRYLDTLKNLLQKRGNGSKIEGIARK